MKFAEMRGYAGKAHFKRYAVSTDFEFPDTVIDGNGGFHNNQDTRKNIDFEINFMS